MSTHFKHYKSGKIFGIIYSFDKAGDGIRMHMHPTEDMEHNTVVLNGSILLYGPNGSFQRLVKTGQILDFDSTLPHEIAALEDGTVIINTFLQGQPEGYDELPPHELQGTLEMELTHKIENFHENPIPVLVH
jgi:hypothetical protein